MLLVGVTIITVYHLCVSVCDSDGEFVLHGGGGRGCFMTCRTHARSKSKCTDQGGRGCEVWEILNSGKVLSLYFS